MSHKAKPNIETVNKNNDHTIDVEALSYMSMLDQGLRFDFDNIDFPEGNDTKCLYVSTENDNPELVEAINDLSGHQADDVRDIYARTLERENGEPYVGIIMPQINSIEELREVLDQLDGSGCLSANIKAASRDLGERILDRTALLGDAVAKAAIVVHSNPTRN